MKVLSFNQEIQKLARSDDGAISFIGAGRYSHDRPPLVDEMRTLFADCPINNANQGSLAALYAYQTALAQLTGMDNVALGLIDGSAALRAAVAMARSLHAGHKVLMPRTLAPHWRNTLADDDKIDLDYQQDTGLIALDALPKNSNACALLLPYPNFFGLLEDVDALIAWANQQGLLTLAVVNPLAISLRPPNTWGQGADIVCGSAQPLGLPPSLDVGFLACRARHQAKLRGHWVEKVGEHYRLSDAQADTAHDVLALSVGVYLALQGIAGIQQQARLNQQKLALLCQAVEKIAGIRRRFAAVCFNEVVLQVDKPVRAVLRTLAAHNILAGLDLNTVYPDLPQTLLICCTEIHSDEQITKYINHLHRLLEPHKLDTCPRTRPRSL